MRFLPAALHALAQEIFVRQPLLPAAAAFGLGVLLDGALGWAGVGLGAAGLLGAAWGVRRRSPSWALPIGALLAVLGLGCLHSLMDKQQVANHLHVIEGRKAYAEVELLSPLRPLEGGYGTKGAVQVLLAGGERLPVQGRSLLYFPGMNADSLPLAGERLRVHTQFDSLAIPDAPGYEAYLRNRGITHTAFVREWECLGAANGAMAMLRRKQNQLANRFDALLADSAASGVAQAMLLGVRAYLPRPAREAYAKAGLAHLLALSGLHVGLLLAGMQGVGWLLMHLFRWRWHPGVVLMMGVLIGYAGLTGFSAAVSRAVLMGCLMLLPRLFRREHFSLNGLAAAFLILLVVRPAWLADLGFQLSFAAVLGIFLLQPVIARALRTRYGALNFFVDILSVTLSAQLFVLPAILHHFGEFPAYFLYANLLLTPIALPVVAGGFVLLFTFWIPGWNALLAIALNEGFGLMNRLTAWFAAQPGARIATGDLPAGWALAVFAGILLGVLWLRYRYRRELFGSGRIQQFLQ